MMYKNVAVLLTTFLPQTNGLFNNVVLRSTSKLYLPYNSKQYHTTKTKKNCKQQKEEKNDNINLAMLHAYLMKYAPNIINIAPKKNLKVTHTSTDLLYLANPETANEIVSFIIEDLKKNNSFVAELNPGMGFLTKELLEAGVPFVHLYEENLKFCEILQQLMSKYPNRLSLKNSNLFKIAKIMYIDNITNNQKVQELLNGVHSKAWEEDSSLQIIGAVTTPVFIRHLIMSLLFQNGFMEYGRPVLFLAIPPSVWKMFTNIEKRKSTMSIMFEILFNYKLLGTINRKSFIPWQKKVEVFKRHEVRIWLTEDHEIMNIVKIEPKPDLYIKYLKKQDLIHFWHFVRHNAVRTTRKVIPELEKMIPSCGIRLIAKDYNIFTQFSDLSPLQFLDLYNEFRSWPEFEKCGFLPAVNSIISKMDENLILDLGSNYDFN